MLRCLQIALSLMVNKVISLCNIISLLNIFWTGEIIKRKGYMFHELHFKESLDFYMIFICMRKTNKNPYSFKICRVILFLSLNFLLVLSVKHLNMLWLFFHLWNEGNNPSYITGKKRINNMSEKYFSYLENVWRKGIFSEIILKNGISCGIMERLL